MLRLTPIVLLTTLAFSAAAQSPADLLTKATASSTLSDIQRPWHATLAITIFDAKGHNPTEGTFDYWQNGADSLTTVTLGDIKWVFLRSNGKRYEKESPSPILDTAGFVRSFFLNPGPSPKDPGLSKPITQRKQKFGTTELSCLMLGPDMLVREQTPLGLFPTYCVDPSNNILRLLYSMGGKQLTIQRTGAFLDHIVPMEFSIGEGGAVIARAKVTTMATFTPDPNFFDPRPDLPEAGFAADTAHISNAVTQGLKIGGDQPVYPVGSRQNHIQGTVILQAVIGRDGHIRSLRVVSAPAVDLAISALAAVSTWRYKPYLLNGNPVTVDTTIVVNFNIN